MYRRPHLSLLAALSLALLVPSAARADNPAGFGEGSPGEFSLGTTTRQCGTPLEAVDVSAPDQEIIEQWAASNQIAAGGVIPVNFHVIYNSTSGEGNVPESQLDAQITVMNRNFAGQDYNGNPVAGARNTGYTFVKASVDRTANSKYFTMTPGSRNEKNAKNALGINETSSLNFYTAKPGQNLLGWATFPWNLAGNPSQDGVVIHYASLPGGTLAPYNLGGTATHEVGHWVGLYHTFQGGCHSDATCTTAGDLVCDTPAEGTSTSGCPVGKESCTSSAGADPINNYMDYSTDACYNNFTAGQDARADFMMSTYRPSIGSAAPGVIAANGQRFDTGNGDAARMITPSFAQPNPFRGGTTIHFALRQEGVVRLDVYDVTGRKVSTLVDRSLPAGAHTAEFDGSGLPNGVYFYLIDDGHSVQKNRLLLTR